jgi:hypothetical protein
MASRNLYDLISDEDTEGVENLILSIPLKNAKYALTQNYGGSGRYPKLPILMAIQRGPEMFKFVLKLSMKIGGAELVRTLLLTDIDNRLTMFQTIIKWRDFLNIVKFYLKIAVQIGGNELVRRLLMRDPNDIGIVPKIISALHSATETLNNSHIIEYLMYSALDSYNKEFLQILLTIGDYRPVLLNTMVLDRMNFENFRTIVDKAEAVFNLEFVVERLYYVYRDSNDYDRLLFGVPDRLTILRRAINMMHNTDKIVDAYNIFDRILDDLLKYKGLDFALAYLRETGEDGSTIFHENIEYHLLDFILNRIRELWGYEIVKEFLLTPNTAGNSPYDIFATNKLRRGVIYHITKDGRKVIMKYLQ